MGTVSRRSGAGSSSRARLPVTVAWDVARVAFALAALQVVVGWLLAGGGAVAVLAGAERCWPIPQLGLNLAVAYMRYSMLWALPLALILRLCRWPRWLMRWVGCAGGQAAVTRHRARGCCQSPRGHSYGHYLGCTLVAAGAVGLVFGWPLGAMSQVGAGLTVLVGATVMRASRGRSGDTEGPGTGTPDVCAE